MLFCRHTLALAALRYETVQFNFVAREWCAVSADAEKFNDFIRDFNTCSSSPPSPSTTKSNHFFVLLERGHFIRNTVFKVHHYLIERFDDSLIFNRRRDEFRLHVPSFNDWVN